MGRVTLDEIDLGSVEDAVAMPAYMAGYRAVEDGAVRRMEWDGDKRGLHGVVQDRDGEMHETVVFFTGGCPMMFVRSFCSCQTGSECKHAASVALAGALASGQDLTGRPQSANWEHSFTTLLESRRQPARGPIAAAPIATVLTPPAQAVGQGIQRVPARRATERPAGVASRGRGWGQFLHMRRPSCAWT